MNGLLVKNTEIVTEIEFTARQDGTIKVALRLQIRPISSPTMAR